MIGKPRTRPDRVVTVSSPTAIEASFPGWDWTQAGGRGLWTPVAVADLARLPFQNQSFDAVIAISSVEFCRDRAVVFREFHRVLKDGGKAYLDVRNDDFLPFRLLKPWLPILRWAGILQPYPAQGFRDLSPQEWVSELSRQGFRLVSMHPSVWPWNFGNAASRSKNMLIHAIRQIFPIRDHYMVGLLLEKAP